MEGENVRECSATCMVCVEGGGRVGKRKGRMQCALPGENMVVG